LVAAVGKTRIANSYKKNRIARDQITHLKKLTKDLEVCIGLLLGAFKLNTIIRTLT